MTAALVLLAGCGLGGQSPGGGPPAAPPEPPAPEPGLSLRTTVGFDPLFYKLPPLPPCLSVAAGVALPTLPSGFTVDGSFADWAKVPPFAANPAVSVALTPEQDLAVAAALRPDQSESLNVELGGVVAQKGVVHGEIRRLFRVYQGTLEVFQSGAWKTVASDGGAAAVGQGGTELRLSRLGVGDVLTWPLWWVRVFVRDESRGLAVQSTGAAYYPSVLGGDNAPFAVDRCDLWAGRATPLSLLQLRDTLLAPPGPADAQTAPFAAPAPAPAPAPAAAPAPEAAWTPPKPDWSVLSERAFALTRAAYDGVQALLGGESLPVSAVAVLGTQDAVSPLVDGVGAGDAYYGAAAPYRGLLLDLASLAPAATVGFPEGPLFEHVAGTLLDLLLSGRFPGAPPLLAAAVRQALLDHLAVQTLGESYVLDQFAPTVDPLVAAPPAAGALTAAKAVGFGHLLAAEVDAKALLAAWKGAAAGTSAGVTPEEALLAALVQARSGDAAGQDRLERLWQGWLTADAYDPSLAPAQLGDADGDGVPDYLEARRGSRADLADSDGDGWADVAETILGTDPKTSANAPTVLVPDGDFGDWQRLLPRRLIAGHGIANPACPKAATIGYFAAIASKDALLVGAYAADFLEGEGAARWEVELDFVTDKRQVLLTAAGDAHTYDLYDTGGGAHRLLKTWRRALPMARRAFEVAVPRAPLFLPTPLDQANAVRMQLRTVFTDKAGDHVCDQTDWFVPYTTGD